MSQLKVNQIDSKTTGTPLVILSRLTVSDSTPSTTSISGSITTNGGIGILKDANIGGVLNVSSALASTTTDTGSITTKGGLGIVGDANIGGMATIKTGLRVDTSPTADISLRVYEDSDTSNWMRLRPSDHTSARQQGFLFSNNGDTTVLAVDTKLLRVGVGTYSPTVALDISGEARSSTSTTTASNAKTLTTKDYVDGKTLTNTSIGVTAYPMFPNSAANAYVVGVGYNPNNIFKYNHATKTLTVDAGYGTWKGLTSWDAQDNADERTDWFWGDVTVSPSAPYKWVGSGINSKAGAKAFILTRIS